MMLRIIAEYKKWSKNWDDLCDRCGLCCYDRCVSRGKVVIDYSSACEFLDQETRLCRVFESRFSKHPDCGRVNIIRALFHRYLPPDCAYVRTFRVWKNKDTGG